MEHMQLSNQDFNSSEYVEWYEKQLEEERRADDLMYEELERDRYEDEIEHDLLQHHLEEHLREEEEQKENELEMEWKKYQEDENDYIGIEPEYYEDYSVNDNDIEEYWRMQHEWKI